MEPCFCHPALAEWVAATPILWPLAKFLLSVPHCLHLEQVFLLPTTQELLVQHPVTPFPVKDNSICLCYHVELSQKCHLGPPCLGG